VLARVLVADHDKRRQAALLTVLQGAGYHVLAVADGEAALAAASRHLPDLIITQHALPLIDGLALCRRLRAEIDVRDIPIVVVTPFDDAGSRHQIVAAGATRIVSASWSTTTCMVRYLDRLVARPFRRQRSNCSATSQVPVENLPASPGQFGHRTP
jgi:CheY-like chemotaxis protein